MAKSAGLHCDFDQIIELLHNFPMGDEFYEHGKFLCLDGPAKRTGLSHSSVKVCFVSTAFEFLRSLLIPLAGLEACYWVKMTREARDGMFLGRSFFTSTEYAGEIWARYKNHPKVMANLQDDELAAKFRPSSLSLKD